MWNSGSKCADSAIIKSRTQIAIGYSLTGNRFRPSKHQDMVVNGAEMELILAPLWTKMLALQKDNSMQLMMRPPKEADRKDWGNQATQTRHAPIILEAGTSSYLYNHKIVENVRANRLGGKVSSRATCRRPSGYGG